MNYARNTFHKAAEAMLRYGANPIATWAREHLILSHKFIVPDAGKMTAGKPMDDFKDCLKLPFPRISLLREIEVGGEVCQQICMASSPDNVTGPSAGHIDFFVADVLAIPGREDWAPTRPIGIKLLNGPGVQLMEIQTAIEHERALYGGTYDDHADGFGALNGLSELLLMLSLKNVSTKTIEASAALNRKRARSGKLPLYDYHVLVIDGQEVYERDGDGESDRKIRSHYRRGHIRRLGDDHRVWVRATFVHGAGRGFVDKDYRIKAPGETEHS